MDIPTGPKQVPVGLQKSVYLDELYKEELLKQHSSQAYKKMLPFRVKLPSFKMQNVSTVELRI